MDNAATQADTGATDSGPGSAFSRGAAQPYEVNRLIGGAAFLRGHAYREKLIGFFRHNHNAVAPEYGVDIPLLLKICIKAKRTQAAYDALFLLAIAMLAVDQYLIQIPFLTRSAVILIVCTSVLAGAHMRRQARQFSKSNFNLADIQEKYQDVTIPADITPAIPNPNQNLIVYRGFLPFIGAGYFDGGWSFDCALTPSNDELARKPVKPFSAAELYACIRQALQALQVPDLQVVDRLFISGGELRDEDQLFSGHDKRPVQVIDDARLRRCMGLDHVRMRHYLCIHVSDWGGELVTTYFVRVVLRAKSLYVEYSRLHLRPVANEHRMVDRMPGYHSDRNLSAAVLDIGMSPVHALSALLHAVTDLVSVLQRHLAPNWHRRRHLRRIRANIHYNYGTSGSVRESLSGQLWQHFFQRADDDRNRKLVERNLLDALANFLDAHGADTHDLRERRTTILNNGIVVNGGDVRAEALAVGKGASARKTKEDTGKRA